MGHEIKFKFVRIRKIRNTILNRNTSNNLEFNRDDASRKWHNPRVQSLAQTSLNSDERTFAQSTQFKGKKLSDKNAEYF